MGSKQSKPIKIFCFGGDKIIYKIFPKEKTNVNKKEKWEYRQYVKELSFTEKETGKSLEEKIEWNATIYPDITDENIEELFSSLEKNLDIPDEFEKLEQNKIEEEEEEESRKRSKNIIIKFGKNNIEILINYMNSLTKAYLPQIAIVTEEHFDEEKEGLYDNRYLTIIKKNNHENQEDLISKLKCYLWEKECYYNERGNAILYEYPKEEEEKINTNNFINIMITGISRSGKSTLINVLSEKLITLESPFLESVTNQIREYEIITSKNGIFKTGIRFFDTPGLTFIKKKNRNTFDEVKSSIDKKIKECMDARDDIHMIYFVLKGNSNLENFVEFFNYLIKLNNDRIKNNKKKINIIFIFNQGIGDSSEQSLIKFLQDHKLMELYEKIENSKNKKKLSYKERFSKKVNIEENNEIKNNIISVNLLKDKRSNQNVYGIDKLLKTTLYFLKKDNPLTENNFKKLKEIKSELEKIDWNNQIDQRKILEKEACKYFKNISSENSLLSGISNITEILEQAKFEFKKTIFYEILFLSLFSLSEKNKINKFISFFKKIEHCYKIYTNEIVIVPLINKNENEIEFRGFQIWDHINDNNKEKINLVNEMKKQLLELENFNNLKIKESKLHINDKIYDFNPCKEEYFQYFQYLNNLFYYAFVPILGIIKYRVFGEYISEYFENYIKKQCCIDYITIQRDIYLNIFNQIEEMSNKNDWDKFHLKTL